MTSNSIFSPLTAVLFAGASTSGAIPGWALALGLSLTATPLLALLGIRMSALRRPGSKAIENEVIERTRSLELHSKELKLVNLRLEKQILRSHEAAEARRVFDSRLQQSQRLESLGVLAGGIAHDFNNLLVGIMGNAELALHEAGPESTVSQGLRDIVAASERAADLCNQMLAYAGKSPFRTDELELNSAILSIKGLIDTSFEDHVRVEYDLGQDMGLIGADRAQIEQAIINLVTNAAEAIEGEGTVTLRTGRRSCPEGFFEERSYPYELPAGDYVFLEVSDTGRGMSEKIRSRIFEPFFTTKFMGRGLGLAAAFGIVRRHRGAITVESVARRGSRFSVYFPLCHDGMEFVETKQGAQQLSLLEDVVSGRVLVVDDEELVRDLAAMALNRDGISTVLAEDGTTALNAMREMASDISCVLLDMTMPRMDGETALHEIKKIAPQVPIVIMSAHSERQLARQFQDGEVFHYLSKPFAIDQLRTVIKQAILSQAEPTTRATHPQDIAFARGA